MLNTSFKTFHKFKSFKHRIEFYFNNHTAFSNITTKQTTNNLYNWTERECQTYCSKHGKCDGGLCTCFPGYRGLGCRSCVKSPQCQHGVCEGQNGCKCHPGWAGVDCDIKLDIECQNSGVAKINSRGLFELVFVLIYLDLYKV